MSRVGRKCWYEYFLKTHVFDVSIFCLISLWVERWIFIKLSIEGQKFSQMMFLCLFSLTRLWQWSGFLLIEMILFCWQNRSSLYVRLVVCFIYLFFFWLFFFWLIIYLFDIRPNSRYLNPIVLKPLCCRN